MKFSEYIKEANSNDLFQALRRAGIKVDKYGIKDAINEIIDFENSNGNTDKTPEVFKKRIGAILGIDEGEVEIAINATKKLFVNQIKANKKIQL